MIGGVYCNMSGFFFSLLARQTIHISTILSLDRVCAGWCYYVSLLPQYHSLQAVRGLVNLFSSVPRVLSCVTPEGGLQGCPGSILAH